MMTNRRRYEVVLLLIPVLAGCLDILGYKDPALDECAPAGCTGGGGAGQGGATSTGGTAGTGGSGGVGGAGGVGGGSNCESNDDCVETMYCARIDTDLYLCVDKEDIGTPCGESESYKCMSGFCTDGVCCDSLCDETCKACAVEKTGSTSGYCGNVPPFTNPDGECVAPGSCYKGHCLTGSNSEPCSSGNHCVSGFCPMPEAICCDSACDGMCEACTDFNGTSGTCMFIAAMYDPDNECPGVDACDGAGMCQM